LNSTALWQNTVEAVEFNRSIEFNRTIEIPVEIISIDFSRFQPHISIAQLNSTERLKSRLKSFQSISIDFNRIFQPPVFF